MRVSEFFVLGVATSNLPPSSKLQETAIQFFMTCNFESKISNILPKCTFHYLKQIHALIITTSLVRNLKIFSKFLRRSTEFGSMDYSNLIFSQMGRNLNSEIMPWNVMIRGYAFNGPVRECILLFDEMPQRGVKPNNYTYPYVLNSCCELGDCRKGKAVHCQIIKSGFESSYAVTNSLFNMYIKLPASFDLDMTNTCKLYDARNIFDDMRVRPVDLCNRMISEYIGIGDVRSARQLFEIMPERDAVSWNSMISGYAKVGEVENARKIFEWMPEKNVISWTSMIGAYADAGNLGTARRFFEKMPHRNVVSWNSMISSYSKHGKFAEALDLFDQMQSGGVIPDGYTFVSVLSACSNIGALDFGKWIHYQIGDWCQLGIIVGTALVEMYAQCGDVNRAFAIFIKIGKKDEFCWNVMIKALAIHGRTKDAIRLFYLMQNTKLKPNHFTFTSALFACNHGGMMQEARSIFYMMEDYKITPKIEHFGCLIDLLCRNGLLDEALLLLENMPFKPDIAIWGSLLGGCRLRSDLSLAEKVVERATELETNESGVYVLLSNIHASAGQWLEALGARKKMEEKKIWKKAGHSTIV